MATSIEASNGVVEIWVDGTKISSASNLKNCHPSGISVPAYQAANLCAFFGLGSIYLSACTNFAQGDTTPFGEQKGVDNLVVTAGDMYSKPPGDGGADTTAPAPQPMYGCNR